MRMMVQRLPNLGSVTALNVAEVVCLPHKHPSQSASAPLGCAQLLPLFHEYHHASLRPELLQPADRALFHALIAAGYKVLLTPVIVRITCYTYDFCVDYSIGPYDPYDWIYSASKIKDEAGRMMVLRSSAHSFTLQEKVQYLYTNGDVQATQLPPHPVRCLHWPISRHAILQHSYCDSAADMQCVGTCGDEEAMGPNNS